MPKADAVGKMAKALGTTVEYLVTGVELVSAQDVAEHAPGYGWTKVQDEKTRAWVGKHPELISDLMALDEGELVRVQAYANGLRDARPVPKTSAG